MQGYELVQNKQNSDRTHEKGGKGNLCIQNSICLIRAHLPSPFIQTILFAVQITLELCSLQFTANLLQPTECWHWACTITLSWN